ncbi:MAG: GNAT family N-acetyltransferase [Marmoricola sp.]
MRTDGSGVRSDRSGVRSDRSDVRSDRSAGVGTAYSSVVLSIARADFDDPQLAQFLREHLDDMAPTAPPESQHALDLEELRRPSVRLWVAHDEGRLVGTAALAELEAGHEELKSMRTDPDLRGAGIATRLLVQVIEDARRRGIGRISLETGSMEFFTPARALYLKHGFTECEPFGTYGEDPNSTFMTRAL